MENHVPGSLGKLVNLSDLLNTRRAFGAVFARKILIKELGRHIIYLVWRGGELLYIGSTNYSARDRLKQHLYSNASELGAAMRSGKPWSGEWIIEVVGCPDTDRNGLQKYEHKLIKELEPSING